MKLNRYKDILAIKTETGKVVGFHSRNLQVAHLDEPVWAALSSEALPEGEVGDEIQAWNSEVDPNATDFDLPQAVRSLAINIAQVCNLKCTYCAAGGDGSYGDPMKDADLDTLYEQIRMLLHDVPAGEAFSIRFFGGEPLVVPQAVKSIARFAKLQVAGRGIDLRFSLTTNGTLVTPEIARMLASFNCHVTVSIDGPPEVNDISRPTASGRGSSKLVLRGLENLRAVRHELGSLAAGAVFGKHHQGVLATYKFLQPFDLDTIKFDFAAEDGDAEASQNYSRELMATADEAFRSGGEAELRRINLFDMYFSALDRQKRSHNHCGAGKSHLQVDTRGRMSVCQWWVNLPEEEIGRGLQIDHQKLEHYRDRLVDLNDCGGCWARHLCGGGCMFVNRVKNGDKHKKDNEYCSRTRNTIAKAVELYAEARV